MPRTAVIGAGPSGCAAAWQLHRAGREVVLFERAPEVGGRTISHRSRGRVVDTGAGFFTNFYPHLQRCAKELGLEPDIAPLSRTNVLVHKGQAYDFTLGSVGSFLRFPFVSAWAKLRMANATAMATLRFRGLDWTDPAALRELDSCSIADDARVRVGEDVYEFLIRPGIEPFWYFSCEDVSRALYLALQARAADARFFTLRHGMDELCRAVAERVPCRASVQVEALSPRGSTLVVHAPGVEEAFDEVVIATTARSAHALIEGLDRELVDDAQRRFLVEQRYVPNIHLVYEVPRQACPPASAAFPCGPGEFDIAAVAFNSHKQQGEPGAYEASELVSVFLSARESARSMDLDDVALQRRGWELARAAWPVLPPTAEPHLVVRRTEAIPVHAVHRFARAAEFARRQRAPVVFAGDYLSVATVDGAIASGERAARVLLDPS